MFTNDTLEAANFGETRRSRRYDGRRFRNYKTSPRLFAVASPSHAKENLSLGCPVETGYNLDTGDLVTLGKFSLKKTFKKITQAPAGLFKVVSKSVRTSAAGTGRTIKQASKEVSKGAHAAARFAGKAAVAPFVIQAKLTKSLVSAAGKSVGSVFKSRSARGGGSGEMAPEQIAPQEVAPEPQGQVIEPEVVDSYPSDEGAEYVETPSYEAPVYEEPSYTEPSYEQPSFEPPPDRSGQQAPQVQYNVIPDRPVEYATEYAPQTQEDTSTYSDETESEETESLSPQESAVLDMGLGLGGAMIAQHAGLGFWGALIAPAAAAVSKIIKAKGKAKADKIAAAKTQPTPSMAVARGTYRALDKIGNMPKWVVPAAIGGGLLLLLLSSGRNGRSVTVIK